MEPALRPAIIAKGVISFTPDGIKHTIGFDRRLHLSADPTMIAPGAKTEFPHASCLSLSSNHKSEPPEFNPIRAVKINRIV